MRPHLLRLKDDIVVALLSFDQILFKFAPVANQENVTKRSIDNINQTHDCLLPYLDVKTPSGLLSGGFRGAET